MKHKNTIPVMKGFDYSSEDCQLLIKEYTQLIGKMVKEYDLLADENEKLRNKLNKYEKIKCQQRFTPGDSLSKAGKLWRALRLYGCRVTIQKVLNDLRKK